MCLGFRGGRMEKLLESLDKIISDFIRYVVKPISVAAVYWIVALLLLPDLLGYRFDQDAIARALLPSSSLQALIDYYGMKSTLPWLVAILLLVAINGFEAMVRIIAHFLPPHLSSFRHQLYKCIMSQDKAVVIYNSNPSARSLDDLAGAVGRHAWANEAPGAAIVYRQRSAGRFHFFFNQAKGVIAFCLLLLTVAALMHMRVSATALLTVLTLVFAAGVYAAIRFFAEVEQEAYAMIDDYVRSLPTASAGAELTRDIMDSLDAVQRDPPRWWLIKLRSTLLPYSLSHYYRARAKRRQLRDTGQVEQIG
jgi:hypothetical protein